MATITKTEEPAAQQLLTGRRRDWFGIAFQVILLGALLFSLAILIVLIIDVLRGGLGVLLERPGSFLSSNFTRIEPPGVWQGIVGSLWLTAIVAVVAFPIGIGAAVYIEEFAPDNKLTRMINVNIRNLAGVPSVVYGLLGLAIFVNALQSVTGGRSLLTAGFTLAILVLPIVVIVTSEALRAVPDSIREAGHGIGATRWEITRSLVLPHAFPMILTGTILSISRAIGETAPLILIGAATSFFVTQADNVVETLQGRFTALPVLVFSWARQPQQEFRELTAAAIIVLLVVLLTANAAAIFVRNHYDKKRHEYQ